MFTVNFWLVHSGWCKNRALVQNLVIDLTPNYFYGYESFLSCIIYLHPSHSSEIFIVGLVTHLSARARAIHNILVHGCIYLFLLDASTVELRLRYTCFTGFVCQDPITRKLPHDGSWNVRNRPNFRPQVSVRFTKISLENITLFWGFPGSVCQFSVSNGNPQSRTCFEVKSEFR
jgi:hypothetical protein